MIVLESIILAAIVSIASYFARFLTRGGATATFFLAALIYALGRWAWTLPIFTFFLSSSILSRLSGNEKRTRFDLVEKSSRRDLGQVLANGSIAGVLVLLWTFSHSDTFYIAYLGAVSAVTADTWSTEIGVLSKREARLITTFARVTRGTSGGITLLGTMMGILASLIIFLSSSPWLSKVGTEIISPGDLLLVILISGFCGNIADSMLGATLQGHYRCRQCGRIGERKWHCAKAPAELVQGKKWATNDAVNFVSSVVGAGVAVVLAIF